MLVRVAVASLSVAIGLAACDAAAPSVDAGPAIDAARADIDPVPYHDPCDAAAPGACSAPYECVEGSAGHTPGTFCLVPCDADANCPVGFFCNGVNWEADVGALEHCVENV